MVVVEPSRAVFFSSFLRFFVSSFLRFFVSSFLRFLVSSFLRCFVASFLRFCVSAFLPSSCLRLSSSVPLFSLVSLFPVFSLSLSLSPLFLFFGGRSSAGSWSAVYLALAFVVYFFFFWLEARRVVALEYD